MSTRRDSLVLASDSYPPLVGGATRATAQLATRLARRGVTVTVVTAWQRGVPAHEICDGVEVFRVRSLLSRVPGASADSTRYTPPPFPDPELVWRLRRIVRRAAPTVIHSYGWLTYSLLAAAGRDAPVILSGRDYGYVCPKRTLEREGGPCSGPTLYKCAVCASREYGAVRGLVSTAAVHGFRRALGRRVSVLHSCSDYVDGALAGRLLGSRLTTIDRPVIPDFRDAPNVARVSLRSARTNELPAEPYILYVGALRRIKGVHLLLRAYAALGAPRPPLVLLGSPAADPLGELPPGASVHTGFENWEVLGAWSGALFGVAPSLWPEPLGNVVHEAMSRGVPVIGVRPGGHASMIDDGRDGVLVPAGALEPLVAAMRKLIDDPALRARLGAAALDKAKSFEEEAVFPRFVEMYRRAGLAVGDA